MGATVGACASDRRDVLATVTFSGAAEGIREFDHVAHRRVDRLSGFRLRVFAQQGGSLMVVGHHLEGEVPRNGEFGVALEVERDDGTVASYYDSPELPCEIAIETIALGALAGRFDCTLTDADGASLEATGTFRDS